jgi:formylglycine-generating enzyme required for sulfatase activity
MFPLGVDESTVAADPLAPLVKKLGAEEFAVRDAAGRELMVLGEKAILTLLKAARNDGDPEIRGRAHQLVLKILPPRRVSKSSKVELALIEGGEYQMGSPAGEKNRRPDEEQHIVAIRGPFYLGAFEVTQEEYRTVMEAEPSWFAKNGSGKFAVGGMDTDRFPVETVTWFDAIDFCNRLSKRDELPAYYRLTDVKREGNAIRSATVTIAGDNGYRLPTEAEWEFACRALTDMPFHFGRGPTGREANFKSSIVPGGYGGGPLWQPLNRTAKVGNYPANGRGLSEMHGNVAEWCWDHYDKDYYTMSPRLEPSGPATGTHRVCRGGSWLVTEASCRSASRFMQSPGEPSYTTGFRVARNP